LHFDVPEGATPLEDASGLKLPGSPTYADLCAAEAENILGAMNIHLKRRKNPSRIWMTADYICRVHRDMYKEVWEWAGMIRSHQTNIGVSAYLIREELVKLCQDIHFW
jgi:fido (protein-threonine AMPylation protein)